jgi:hypothetical protein
MNKRKKTGYNPDPWARDPNKRVAYEFLFNGHLVTPGMQFRVKGDRIVYTFQCLVTDVVTGSTWIQAITQIGFKFPRPEKVTTLVGVKRSYKKKLAA